jgi:hypothetical protein
MAIELVWRGGDFTMLLEEWEHSLVVEYMLTMYKNLDSNPSACTRAHTHTHTHTHTQVIRLFKVTNVVF